MHQVYYVLVNKDEADTPQEAMSEAESTLNSNSFVGEGGYFSGGKWDWFEVGGRWANLLVERHQWARDAMKEIEQMLSENPDAKGEKIRLRGCHYGSSEQQELQEKLRERAEFIWGRYRPQDYPKVRYDRCGSIGSRPQIDDCAELTSPELLKYLQDFAEDVEVFNESECEEMPISSYKPEDFDGSKWLVVIDYHN